MPESQLPTPQYKPHQEILDYDTCHLIVRTLVLSPADYGNGLLLGSNVTDIQRLQRIQNWAAKLICRVTKYDHAPMSSQITLAAYQGEDQFQDTNVHIKA